MNPDAVAMDAFTLSWGGYYFYPFSPFSIILRTLRNIVLDEAEGILVVPLWRSQPWFRLFQELLTSQPVILHPDTNLLSSPFRRVHLSFYPGYGEIVQKSFQVKGYPDESIETSMQSLSKSTFTQYNSSFKLWLSFCQLEKIDPFEGGVKDVLNFFNQGLNNKSIKYGTFNQHRSVMLSDVEQESFNSTFS